MASRPDVTLTQMRYFVEAARLLSMTKSAQKLLVAQSAVSTAISQLERGVGTQLFVRQRSKGLVLTTAGEQFLRDAQALLAGLDEAVDLARGSGSQVRGTIHLACFTTLAPFVLPDLLTMLGNEHPELEVQVLETDADGAAEALRSGAVELAISYDLAYPDDIIRTPVCGAPPYVILPADHRLAQASSVRLGELATEPFVLLDLPRSREYFLSVLSAAGIEPQIRYRSGSYETVRTLVANGHGFAILNQQPVSPSTYSGASVVSLAIEEPVPELSIVLAALAAMKPTARARAVAQVIHHQLGTAGRKSAQRA